ncbi:MAG: hypothetical protein Q7U16_02090 [Agitococcus sp.]|nr:hypothetical protein [Agitococcus sp.]
MKIYLKVVILMFFSMCSIVSKASDVQDLLVISKMTGVCGVMQQMVAFQKVTKMKGGDEFINRFWQMEFARLGKSQETFIKECEGSIAAYDKMWSLAESK